MTPEHPSQWRGLLIWSASALLAVFLVYVLGAGPATYYEVRFNRTARAEGSLASYMWVQKLYYPLRQGAKKTPLGGLLEDYEHWWGQRAAEKYPARAYPF